MNISDCPFGCGLVRADRIRHFAICPVLAHTFSLIFPGMLASSLSSDPLLTLVGLNSSSPTDFIARGIFMHCIIFAHAIARNNGHLSARATISAITSRAVSLGLRCTRTHHFLKASRWVSCRADCVLWNFGDSSSETSSSSSSTS